MKVGEGAQKGGGEEYDLFSGGAYVIFVILLTPAPFQLKKFTPKNTQN